VVRIQNSHHISLRVRHNKVAFKVQVKFNVVIFSLFAGLAGDVVEVVVKIGETSSHDFIVKVFKFPTFSINPFFAQGLTKHTYYIYVI